MLGVNTIGNAGDVVNVVVVACASMAPALRSINQTTENLLDEWLVGCSRNVHGMGSGTTLNFLPIDFFSSKERIPSVTWTTRRKIMNGMLLSLKA